MRRGTAISVVGVVVLLALTSQAQTDRSQLSDRAFRDGQSAKQHGDYKTAYERFIRSYQLEPATGTLLNIADCEEHLGNAAAAWLHFRQGLSMLSAGDDRRSPVEARMAYLDKQLARLTIHLSARAPVGTSVQQDGTPVSVDTIGHPVRANPGEHVVVASAQGRDPRRYEISLEAGQAGELVVEPGDPPVLPSGSPLSPPPSPGSSRRDIGLVAATVGIVGLVGGVVTRLVAFGNHDTIKAHCLDSGGCDSDGWQAVQSARTWQTISTVSLVTGLAGLGVGGYLLFWPVEPATTQAGVSPLVYPGGGGVVLRSAF